MCKGETRPEPKVIRAKHGMEAVSQRFLNLRFFRFRKAAVSGRTATYLGIEAPVVSGTNSSGIERKYSPSVKARTDTSKNFPAKWSSNLKPKGFPEV